MFLCIDEKLTVRLRDLLVLLNEKSKKGKARTTVFLKNGETQYTTRSVSSIRKKIKWLGKKSADNKRQKRHRRYSYTFKEEELYAG